MERLNTIVMIYNPSGNKRWSLQDITTWEKKRHLDIELQAVAGGTTWHTLMEAFQIKDSKTGEITRTGISVDVVNDDAGGGDHTPSTNIYWSSVTGAVITDGSGGGYYGTRKEVEADLVKNHALAISKKDLPHVIDIAATADGLVETLLAGKFDVPDIKLPKKETVVAMVIKKLKLPKRPHSKKSISS